MSNWILHTHTVCWCCWRLYLLWCVFRCCPAQAMSWQEVLVVSGRHRQVHTLLMMYAAAPVVTAAVILDSWPLTLAGTFPHHPDTPRWVSLSLSLSLSGLTAIFTGGSGLAGVHSGFVETKDDSNTCNAPVKSSPTTNQHPTFSPDIISLHVYIVDFSTWPTE